MEARIPSQAANSNTCITGGTQACCDGCSCTLLPVLCDLSGLVQTIIVQKERVHVHRLFTHIYVLVLSMHTHTHARTGVYMLTLFINSRGAGQRCPLDGDSPVRLHLARTHQQGHKVNKRQPLNLVLPDGCKSPKKKREFLLTQIQEDCNCCCPRRFIYI